MTELIGDTERIEQACQFLGLSEVRKSFLGSPDYDISQFQAPAVLDRGGLNQPGLQSADAAPVGGQTHDVTTIRFSAAPRFWPTMTAAFGEEESATTWRPTASSLLPNTDRSCIDFERAGTPRREFLSLAAVHLELADAGNDRCKLNFSGQGRAADPPPGTMFILRLDPSLSGNDGSASDLWQRPRAGVVLSRPPGAYSQDWIGVAISATVR